MNPEQLATIVDRLTALANAEDIVSVGHDVSRYERACHRAARDAYWTALDLIKGTDADGAGLRMPPVEQAPTPWAEGGSE